MRTRFVVQPVRPIIGWTRTICATMESAERERQQMEAATGVRLRIVQQWSEPQKQWTMGELFAHVPTRAEIGRTIRLK